MKKLFYIFVFTLLIFNKSYAASGKGEATTYLVTMKKVEICEDSSCSSSYTIGERDMEADIASVTAGADVGNFSPTTGIPIGTTYTHLRVTIDRTFRITGSVTLTGDDCYTDGTTMASATQMPLGKTSSSAVATRMELVTAGDYGASDGKKDSASNLIINYSSPTYATSMTVSGDNAVMIYALESAYTAGLKPPVIRVKFDTSEAIGAENTSCAMWVEEPKVTIALTN